MRLRIVPTEDEFASFPPVVERKYFSTHDRLRLADAHVPCHTPTGSASRNSSVKKVRKRPLRPNLNRSSSYLQGPPGRQLGKTPSPEIEVSQADALWFLQLPDKLQRKQFTIEEQFLLSGHRESVILDATDEALLKIGRAGSPSSPPSFYSGAYSPHTTEVEGPVDSAVDMNESIEDSFRWLDEDDTLDLTLDDYHAHMIETAVPAAKRASMRPTFRKSLSMTSMALGRNSLSSNDLPHPITSTPQSSSLPQNSLQPRRRSFSTTPPPRPLTRGPIITPDPSAKHYQDPEARLKLRNYLASPQKFDEAIEFGFPSMEYPSISESRRPTMSRPQPSTGTTQTFFNDDDTSLFDEQVHEDEASLPDTEAPQTPSEVAFRNIHRLPSYKPNSADWKEAVSKTFTRRYGLESYAHAESGNREMTLRMTLTRPDLRADETLVYPKGHDPLALEHLSPAKNAGALWDNPSKDRGMVNKLWRKVSRR
ncbi:hypothetical protein MMC08_000375 [Hypocenomyce scalaris]|nr:hypothetical protein [Hypocenomyce scalaris]